MSHVLSSEKVWLFVTCVHGAPEAAAAAAAAVPADAAAAEDAPILAHLCPHSATHAQALAHKKILR